MIDRDAIAITDCRSEGCDDASCRGKGCDDVRIAACKAASGAVKELRYCQVDRCFYVTVDGRERLRSDSEATAYGYFTSPAPE